MLTAILSDLFVFLSRQRRLLPLLAVTALLAWPARADDRREEPFHPLCLRDLLHAGDEGGEPAPLPLAACNAVHRDVLTSTQPGGLTSANGLSAGFPALFGYRPTGRLPDGDRLLLVYENTGGSGTFSSLVRVRIEAGAAVLVRAYGGGDRCNGGLRDARLEAPDRILLDQAITPADLMAAGGLPEALRPYQDLDASAAGCIGFATTARRPEEKPRLVSVTLEQLPDLTGWPEPPSRQACFNEVVRDEIGELPATLDTARVQALAAAVAARCRP
jgi:hypothetical protein